MDEVYRFRQYQREQHDRQKRRRSVLTVLSLPLLALSAIVLILIIGSILAFGLMPLLSYISHDPSPCRIKGEINLLGERKYHVPGDPRYDQVMITTRSGERWFCSEDDAQAAGWRPSN